MYIWKDVDRKLADPPKTSASWFTYPCSYWSLVVTQDQEADINFCNALLSGHLGVSLEPQSCYLFWNTITYLFLNSSFTASLFVVFLNYFEVIFFSFPDGKSLLYVGNFQLCLNEIKTVSHFVF